MTETKPKLHRFLHGYRGYLVKQGKVFKQWSSRYFVLEKRRIKYFEDESAEVILGEMLIDGNAHLYDITEEVDGMKNLLYLAGKSLKGVEENLFLSAASEKDKQDWIEAITDAVHDGFKQIFQPDLWSSDFYPHIDVGIFYRKSGVAAENGNIIRPSNTDYAPDVVFKGVQAEDRYSFIMLDIDPISSIENPSNKFYLHWGVINISGLDIKTGEQLAPYVPPAPVYNSGLHRFFFLLFKQRTFLSSIVLNEITELFHKRDGFPFMKWVRLMDFADPAGINGFYAGWEDYCDTLHHQLNYVPPETFRSPNQESMLKQQQTKKRIEQSMADLYRDLALKDILAGCDQPIPSPSHVPISLQITFSSSSETVKDGQIVSAALALRPPSVNYDDFSSEDHFYTLILTDPDFPSRVNPTQRELVHWVVVNIPKNRIAEGSTLLEYLPPAPPFASGLHRFVFSLFKQTTQLSNELISNGAKFFEKRLGIRSYDWIKLNSACYYISPIALEAFIAEWDESVDRIHDGLRWIPPQPYRSAKQSLKFNSEVEDLEDTETAREARVAELEYELKTNVLQTIAQLHTAPLPTISPKPEPAPFRLTTKDDEIIKQPLRESSPSPQPQPVLKSFISTQPSSEELLTSIKQTDNTRDFVPSPVPPVQTLKPQFTVGITSEDLMDRQKLEKAPLNRQQAMNQRSFILAKEEDEPNKIIPQFDVPAPSTHSSTLTNLEQQNTPGKSPGDVVITIIPAPKSPTSPISPTKTIAITSMDDLDSLFATSPDSGKAEVENYDDDDEVDNASSFSRVSSSNASITKAKPGIDGPDHRSTPASLFKRIGLFKSQSQYMPTIETTSTSAKPKKMSVSTSMYFKPPSADEVSTKPKKLLQSSSMYYKPFENKLTDFAGKVEDSTEILAKCATFDISSSAVFEGEIMKKKFSTDFMFKDSIIWIDPTSKSLHWAKSVTERKSPQFSKFIFLNRVHQEGTVKPLGEMKGIFKSVDFHATSIIVHLESEEFLELKLSLEGTPPTPKRIADWVKVMKALSG